MISVGPHRVTCGCITSPAVDAMLKGKAVSILYTDLPWDNMKYWQTLNRKMTGRETPQITHEQLYERILELVTRYVRGYIFVETGVHWREFAVSYLSRVAKIQVYETSYVSGSRLLDQVVIAGPTLDCPFKRLLFDTYGDEEFERKALASVRTLGGAVLDPCCGFGATARATLQNNMVFYGNEYNEGRLEKTLRVLRRGCRDTK
jgi:hypothetical protein